MGLVWNIIGFIILIIIVALVIFILYEYFIDKGANICGMSGVSNSPIFGSLCKCTGTDGKDLNGECYTCPTINSKKTVRTLAAVTASNACASSVTPILNSYCTDLYGAGTDSNGQCYTCNSGYSQVIGDPSMCGPTGSILSDDKVNAISLGPSVFPATLTTAVLF